jgi:hypothetical protein
LLRLFRSSSAAAPRPAHRPLGELLVRRGLIDRATLDWALARQRDTGERLGRVLLAAGKVRRLDLCHVLAEQWGLPFIDLLHTPIDADLAQRFEPSRLVAEGWMPVRRDGGRVIVATCEPLSDAVRAELRRQLGGRVVIDQRTTTPLDIERAVLSVFKHFIVEHSTVELLTERPDLSAAEPEPAPPPVALQAVA